MKFFSLQILPKNFIQNLYQIKKLLILQMSLICISLCRSQRADSIYVYIFTFQPSFRKISKNNGSFWLGQIFHLDQMKQKLKYIPGNIITL